MEFAVADQNDLMAESCKKIAAALDTLFPNRYADTAARLEYSFVFEVQLFL